MTGQKSDSESRDEAPVTGEVRGAKAVQLTSKRARSRAVLRDILVTPRDIENAMPEDSHACMIADAIKRQHPDFRNVLVDVQSIRWTDPVKGRRVMALTPTKCQAALTAFDLGVKPEPFSFELRSAQVTSLRVSKLKVGEDGKTVRHKAVSRRRLADGTVKEYVVDKAVRERVAFPSSERELVNNDPVHRPCRTHVVGGMLPPVHKASRLRKFGMRQFTWLDGEDAEVVARRQQVAYGWSDEQMAANGWRFAKDRLVAKAEKPV